MTFEAIKQCAINKDLDGLKHIDKEKAITDYIDNRNVGDHSKIGSYYLTPAGDLAQEGKLEAVEFLRKHGACKNSIAFGFALAGNVDMAEKYRIELSAKVDHIAFGFALGGHVESAESYREKFKVDIDEIALGFAIGGHMNEVEKYIEAGADVNYVAFGFAKGGHTEHVEKCQLQFGASIAEIANGFSVGEYGDQSETHYAMKATAVSLLNDYIAAFKDTPITIRSDIKYPAKCLCLISHKPPTIPVRVKGFGTFDYHSIMEIPEMYMEGHGRRRLPFGQNVIFYESDIIPDEKMRDELLRIAKSSPKTNPVSLDAQVTFARQEAIKISKLEQQNISKKFADIKMKN